jgi:hypothetical protein
MKRTKDESKKRAKKETLASIADRHELYELAVQCAEAEVDFVDAEFQSLRGRKACFLKEDFCGSAQVCSEWVTRRSNNQAIGVDLDNDVMAWGIDRHISNLKISQKKRIKLVCENVLTQRSLGQDIILAMNFSYWIFKQRSVLKKYFKQALKNLSSDGVFFLDCFGGSDSYRVIKEKTDIGDFKYIWDQASYNAVTGDFQCYIHFQFPDRSKIQKAFSYDWRLWSLPEIQEILLESGFSDVHVYTQLESDNASEDMVPVTQIDPDLAWIAYIAALK